MSLINDFVYLTSAVTTSLVGLVFNEIGALLFLSTFVLPYLGISIYFNKKDKLRKIGIFLLVIYFLFILGFVIYDVLLVQRIGALFSKKGVITLSLSIFLGMVFEIYFLKVSATNKQIWLKVLFFILAMFAWIYFGFYIKQIPVT